MRIHLRITEKRRLATAAAAITQRIVILSRPLVFLPILPFKKGSTVVAIVVGIGVDGRKVRAISCISVCSLRPRQGRRAYFNPTDMPQAITGKGLKRLCNGRNDSGF